VSAPRVKASSFAVAGAVVLWDLTGGLLDLDDLQAAWVAGGLDPALLPGAPTRLTALRRTMQCFREPGVRVRPLRAVTSAGAVKTASMEDAEGFVLVQEMYGADGRPSYTLTMECALNAPGTDIALTPADPMLEGKIRSAWHRQLVSVNHTDVSSWLIRMATTHLAALPLKARGGTYFVPDAHVDTWAAWVAALRAAGSAHQLHTVRVLGDDDAVAAVLDAVVRESRAAVDALHEQLDDAGTDGMSARKLTGRAGVVAEWEARLASYDSLLGDRLAAVRDELEEVRARIVQAKMVALAAEAQ
jgi:hypothetical protein